VEPHCATSSNLIFIYIKTRSRGLQRLRNDDEVVSFYDRGPREENPRVNWFSIVRCLCPCEGTKQATNRRGRRESSMGLLARKRETHIDADLQEKSDFYRPTRLASPLLSASLLVLILSIDLLLQFFCCFPLSRPAHCECQMSPIGDRFS
jgi:hypothetical protein